MPKLYFRGRAEVYKDESVKRERYYVKLKMNACDELLGEVTEINGIVEISERQYSELQNKILQMNRQRERLEIGGSLDIFAAKVGD